MDGDLVNWSNIQEVMEKLHLEHTCRQWRLFIDSSKVSLKVVLLNNGNQFPSIPLARAVHVKKKKKNMQDPSGFAAKHTLWRTPVEYMRSPKSYNNANWAASWIH